MKKISHVGCVVGLLWNIFSCGNTSNSHPKAAVATSSTVGVPCTSNSDCAAHLECVTQMPGGYCTQDCSSTQACPDLSTCVISGGLGSCYANCVNSQDCRTNYACNAGVCTQSCVEDADCFGGSVCVQGSCNSLGVGESCTSNAGCLNGLSCNTVVLGGICTQGCTASVNPSNDTCPVGSACGVAHGVQTCLPTCRMLADCKTSQICLAGVCTTACQSDQDCLAANTCQVTTGLCIASLPTANAGMQMYFAGNFKTYYNPNLNYNGLIDANNVVHAIEFGVTDVVAGMILLVQGDPNHQYIIDTVTRPDLTQLIGTSTACLESKDPSVLVECGPLRTNWGDELAMVQLPNTAAAAVQPAIGVWQYTFQSDASQADNANAYVYYKYANNNNDATGQLAMHIFLAPGVFGSGVTAQTAATNPNIQNILSRWGDYYTQQAGVVLNSVDYTDTSAAYAHITSIEEAQTMFAQYSKPNGLNVFFVQSIDIAGSNGSAVDGVVGFSLNIPGPPGLAGTLQSGVVLEPQNTDVLTGDVLSHEIGHFLGLYHTDEIPMQGNVPTVHDLIDDTPVCTDITHCPDGFKQMMFPYLTGDQNIITVDQAYIIKSYSLVQ